MHNRTRDVHGSLFFFLCFFLPSTIDLGLLKMRSWMAAAASATLWYRRRDAVGTVPITRGTRTPRPLAKTFRRLQGRRGRPDRPGRQGLPDPRERVLFSSLNRSRGPAPLSRHPATVSTPSSTPIDPTLRGWRTTHRPTASSRTTRGWCPTAFRVHGVTVSHVSGLIAASRVLTPAKRIETWDRKLCPMGSHLFFLRGTAIYLGHAGATGGRGMYPIIFPIFSH